MEKPKFLSNFEVLRLVRDSRSTKHSQRLVLQAMALRANPKKGYSCFPSYETLALDTLLDEKTVRRAAADLEKADLISRRDQAYSSNLFYLNVRLLQEQANMVRDAAVKKEESTIESPFDEPLISDDMDAADIVTGRVA